MKDKFIILALLLILLMDQVRIMQLSNRVDKFQRDFIEYATKVNTFMNSTNGAMGDVLDTIKSQTRSIKMLAGIR